MGLLAIPLMAIFWQFLTSPNSMYSRLIGVAQTRNVEIWIGDDAASAQIFTPSDSGSLYGAFEATDFTVSPPVFYSAQYSYDADGNQLLRQQQAQGEIVFNQAVARFVPSSDDVTFAIDRTIPVASGANLIPPNTLSLIINTEVPAPLSNETRQSELLGFLRAAVSPELPADGYAVFVRHFSWSGSKSNVLGRIYSRQAINVGGGDHSVAGTMEAFAGISVSGSKNSFEFINAGAPARDFPVSYSLDQFTPCTFDFGSEDEAKLKDHPEVWADAEKTQLLPGIYCALNGEIRLSNSDVSGNVTFVAESIRLSGSDIDLSAYRNGVLVFATGTSAKTVVVSGSRTSWTGIVYVPGGGVDLSGSRHVVDGSIFADRLDWGGSKSRVSYVRELLWAAQPGGSG